MITRTLEMTKTEMTWVERYPWSKSFRTERQRREKSYGIKLPISFSPEDSYLHIEHLLLCGTPITLFISQPTLINPSYMWV